MCGREEGVIRIKPRGQRQNGNQNWRPGAPLKSNSKIDNMTQKLMVYNVGKIAKANPVLRFWARETGNGPHLCQSVGEMNPGTGPWAYNSGHDIRYSSPLCVCLYQCSNPPSSLPIPTSLNPSSLLSPSSSYDTSYGISYGIFLLLCLFVPLYYMFLSLPRNKHTPELAPFAPSLPYITLIKAMRLAYMNLSLTILRHINHITFNLTRYESR